MSTTVGSDAAPDVPARGTFRALRHRDFALFWSAAFVSNTGSWMQNIVVPYVLYDVTGSPAWVGVGGFAQYVPALLLGPVGGVLADRFPRKRVTLVVNMLGTAVAVALWLAWRDGRASPWTTVGLVTLVGVVVGLGLPSWQSLMPSLVPRALLHNAIALNSAQFNASRALGPAIGGLVLHRYGPSTVFALNAASYVAVWMAVAATRAPTPAPATASGVWRQFREGLGYARTHRGILLAVTLVTCVAALGSPVIQFASVFARDVFEVDDRAYGFLVAALGAGAVTSALLLATRAERITRARQASVALSAYCVAVVGFALAPTYGFAVAAMFAIGALYLATVNSLNTAIQLLVEEAYRGRALSLYAMGITGGYPLGSLVQGWVAELVGVRAAVAGAGMLLALVTATVISRPGLVHALDGVDQARIAPSTSQPSPR
jgi:predicted MFS family arabinose efflux permease